MSVDLAHCSRWLKFCELHEDDRTTVVFLCGGGVRIAEGARDDLEVATVSELIKGSVSSEGKSAGERRRGLSAASFEAKLGAEFLWGLVSRDWAGVVLDCLRRQAPTEDTKAEGAVSAAGEDAGPAPAEGSSSSRNLKGENSVVEDGGVSSMAETPAEVRAAFELFDLEGEGCLSGDRLEAWLIDAGFRLSTRYVKTLLRGLCGAAKDGKRLFFEYRRRLWSEAAEVEKADGVSVAPPDLPPVSAKTAVEAVDVAAGIGSTAAGEDSTQNAGSPGRAGGGNAGGSSTAAGVSRSGGEGSA